MPDANRTPTATTGRSGFAHLLIFSGFMGLAVGFGLELYRLALLDQVLGTGVAPDWLRAARFTLLVGSIAVVLFGLYLDVLFDGWLDVVVIGLLIGQWGLPISHYLETAHGGPGNLYGFVGLASAACFACAGIVFGLNYARRMWPVPLLMDRLR